MFLAVIFCFRNEIYGLDSVIYGYVRLYTITEGACPRFVTHDLYISLSVRTAIYGLIRIRSQNVRYCQSN